MAQAIQVLRLPSLGIGLISLASLVVIVLFFAAEKGDRFIIPFSVSLLWGLSTYSFIVTFRAVPDKPNAPLRFFSKLKHTITRLWYGLVGLFFLGATARHSCGYHSDGFNLVEGPWRLNRQTSIHKRRLCPMPSLWLGVDHQRIIMRRLPSEWFPMVSGLSPEPQGRCCSAAVGRLPSSAVSMTGLLPARFS